MSDRTRPQAGSSAGSAQPSSACLKNASSASSASGVEGVYGMLSHQPGIKHPERYVLGKPHSDRAKQFKPFAALRGYEELIDGVLREANEPHDFSDLEEPC